MSLLRVNTYDFGTIYDVNVAAGLVSRRNRQRDLSQKTCTHKDNKPDARIRDEVEWQAITFE